MRLLLVIALVAAAAEDAEETSAFIDPQFAIHADYLNRLHRRGLIRYPLGTGPVPFGTFMQGFRSPRCDQVAGGYGTSPRYMSRYRAVHQITTAPTTPGSSRALVRVWHRRFLGS